MRKKTAFSFLLLLLPAVFPGLSVNALETASIENLAIPPSLGKIESIYRGTEERWVIQIQDVHAQVTAQQNIAALLDHLSSAYGIHTIGIEGAWTKSGMPKSWGLPSSREKQMLAQALLDEDYINGAVYAALFSQNPIQLAGIEDEPLYRQNGAVYLKFLATREATLEKVSTLEKKILAEKQNVYNPALLDFDLLLTNFRDGKKAEKFIPALMQLTDKMELNLEDLQQIQTFKKALAIENGLDQEKLGAEAKRLEKAFPYSGLSFEELLKSGKVSEEKISFYPQSQKYLELMRLQETVHHRPFFEEIETAIGRVKEKLLHTTEEKAIDKRSEAFLAAKKIIVLQASPDELRVYMSLQSYTREDLASVQLEEPLKTGLAFYDAALKRDQAFFQKLMSDASFQGNAAVVTGGFHTDGLSRRLEEAGISYIVITPDLGKDSAPMNEKIYFERLRENLAVSQTFTDLPPEAISDARDQGFVQGVAHLKTERNINAAVEIYRTYQIGEPAKARDLTPTGDFNLLAEDEKSKIVGEYREAQSGKMKITAVIRQSVLNDLLQDTVAAAVWHNEILSNNANKIILINDIDAIFTDTEGKAVVVQPKGDIASILAQEKRKSRGRPVAIGVIDPDFSATDKTLVLPAHPAALLILRPLLEHHDTRISARDLESLDAVRAILADFYRAKGILKAA